MLELVKKFWRNKWVFRSLVSSIYFNFRYLPFKQAVYLPILLYKPKFIRCKGSIMITSNNISTGMVKLGTFRVPIYPNSGIIFENNGGTIVFKGKCSIGNNSAISVGSNGVLIFGDRFSATSSLKVISFSKIEFDDYVLCGWECLFIDTDFHQLSSLYSDNHTNLPSYASIHIGKNNWFAMKNVILKGTSLGANNVIASNSLLSKDYSDVSYCLLGGAPAKIKKTGIFRDPHNDTVIYS